MKKKVAAVITDALGNRVVVLVEALEHTMARHFPLFPKEIVLELIERILRDPFDIFEEQKKHLFPLLSGSFIPQEAISWLNLKIIRR